MLQSRDRKLLVQRASSKTDRGAGRNHPLLRWREPVCREQHGEENLWSSPPTLEYPTASCFLREKRASRRDEMEILYERCAGLDVHKKNVKAWFTCPGEGGKRRKETRTYLTMTQDLLEMRDWLKEQGCTHIAMEATGVYTPPTMLPKRC
jgi:hypothetical protein